LDNTRALHLQPLLISTRPMIEGRRPARISSTWRIGVPHLHRRSSPISMMTRKKTMAPLLHRHRIASLTIPTEQSPLHRLPRTASPPPSRLRRIRRSSLLHRSQMP
jgi:hypothetical protein